MRDPENSIFPSNHRTVRFNCSAMSVLWETPACTYTMKRDHPSCGNNTHQTPLSLSQESTVSSIPSMNKTSYSFLDKHPSCARKQEGEATPSFGFPPAIAMKMGSPDICGALRSGPTLNKVSALPKAQDGTSKHKQNLLNTEEGFFHSLNKAYYSFTLSIPYVHGNNNQIPRWDLSCLFIWVYTTVTVRESLGGIGGIALAQIWRNGEGVRSLKRLSMVKWERKCGGEIEKLAMCGQGIVSEDPALRRDLLRDMAPGSWVGNYHHVFSKAPLSRVTYMTCALTA